MAKQTLKPPRKRPRSQDDASDAAAREAAISDVLRVISDSPGDLAPVFDTILSHTIRLCAGNTAVLWQFDGRTLRFAAGRNMTAEAVVYVREHPLELGTWNPTPQAALERRVMNVLDVFANPGYRPLIPPGTSGRRPNAGTVLAVPLVRGDELFGVITIWRYEKRLFSERELGLMKTFTAQAVIAIQNVRLFNETKEALDQQTATSDILKVISSSTTDVQPVFDAIVKSGLRLFPEAAVVVTLPDGDEVTLAAVANLDPKFDDQWRKRFPFPLTREYMHGIAFLDRRMVDVPDAQANTDQSVAPGIANFLASGYRAITIMPMLRGEAAIGTVTVVRANPGPLSEKQIALLRTFADQAVIAIENARLFNETRDALERQTATADILKVISSSPDNIQPVFGSILEHAMRLCDAGLGTVGLYDGKAYRHRAQRGGSPEYVKRLLDEAFVPRPDGTIGRMIAEGRPVHIPDYRELPAYREREPRAVATVELGGARTYLAVPMLKDGQVLGGITIRRTEVRPFTQRQIDLLSTFASQAVIAIENVRLFREIQEKSAQLEVANQHKSEFLANMSHELRTPLNAVIGFSEALMEKMFGEVNEKQADYLKDIHESGKHLLSLINDILDLSKIEAGRMELDVSTFHLPSALSNAMTLIRERAQRHGIELKLAVDERLGEVNADERKFKQIMLNLLSNAVKFTPDGGKVDVSARKHNGQVEVAVRDTGIGIAPEDQALVFEEFRQVGRDQMRKAEGTGLGLALTKRFVELHGGAIRLESAPGRGSTFSFTLPVR